MGSDNYSFDDFQMSSNSNKLNVVKASFISEEEKSWEDLFTGFDELYAITFSSGIKFMANVIDNFEYTEVIFGNESVMGEDVSIIMSIQKAELKYFANNKKSVEKLADKREKDELRFYVSRDTKSHEKIYALKSYDGKYRVICGSANFSHNAFAGVQRENITYFDSEEAYDYYKKLFDDFKSNCTDEVTKKTIDVIINKGETGIDEDPIIIPISQSVETNTVIIEKSNNFDDDYEIIADAKNINKDIKSITPKADKTGKTILTPAIVKK